MSNVLLITNAPPEATTGGRALLCKLNRDALTEIFGPDLIILELPQARSNGVAAAAGSFFGYIDGLNRAVLQQIFDRIDAWSVRQVFIDGSNLGEAARAIKDRHPAVEVVTFFHNVEARFFLGALRHTRRPQAFAVMLANFLAERKAVRNSDKRVSLSERDSLLLEKLYGRRATHVAPMALQDRAADSGPEDPPKESFALFVGGAFYANAAGITWYADRVAPQLRVRTYVVGHGFDRLKARLEHSGKLEVVGAVPSLASWYRSAHVVVAPIFDGSGMKTKVAEALMFGKRVIGTREAFTGYEDVAPEAGEICETADDFVVAMHRNLEAPFCAMDKNLRSLYDQNYSYPAACQRLRQILAA